MANYKWSVSKERVRGYDPSTLECVDLYVVLD